MQHVIDFLQRLKAHNDRAWFGDHKAEFLEVQARWHDFCGQLLTALSPTDPWVTSLSVSDCTYRIYRDTRFSHDKSPYKTHFGVFIAPGGKKAGHAGYYFHVGTGGGTGYPDAHMLAAGHYCYDRRVVQIVREDIVDGDGDFDRIVSAARREGFDFDPSDRLSRLPQPYAAIASGRQSADEATQRAVMRWQEYLRLKVYCLSRPIDTATLLAPDLPQRVAAACAVTRPLLNYLNRAIDYAQEMG